MRRARWPVAAGGAGHGEEALARGTGASSGSCTRSGPMPVHPDHTPPERLRLPDGLLPGSGDGTRPDPNAARATGPGPTAEPVLPRRSFLRRARPVNGLHAGHGDHARPDRTPSAGRPPRRRVCAPVYGVPGSSGFRRAAPPVSARALPAHRTVPPLPPRSTGCARPDRAWRRIGAFQFVYQNAIPVSKPVSGLSPLATASPARTNGLESADLPRRWERCAS